MDDTQNNYQSFDDGTLEAEQLQSFDDGMSEMEQPQSFDNGTLEAEQPQSFDDGTLEAEQPQSFDDGMLEAEQPQSFDDGMSEMEQPQSFDDGTLETEQPQSVDNGMSEMEQPQSFDGATLYSSSNGGIPIENLGIPANVDDGNDVEKLDFTQQYASPNDIGNDSFSGTSGANTFDVNLLLNAKPEIYQQHVDGEGRIDWEGVTGENNNYHDHWLDSMGQDTIVDFSGTGGDGDKINISGHTVEITLLEESDNQVKLGVYTDQDADGSRGTGAHDFDVLGTLTINHDGNFDFGSDVVVDPNVNDGSFDFA